MNADAAKKSCPTILLATYHLYAFASYIIYSTAIVDRMRVYVALLSIIMIMEVTAKIS